MSHDPTSLNGISADNRAKLSNQLRDARLVRGFSGPWTVTSTWQEGFKSTSSVRGHEVPFDEPADLAADDSAPTPHEYLLSALGGCVVAGVVMHATVQGVQLTHLEVGISGTFDNILKWAGLDTAGSPGYRAIEMHATISGNAADDVLRAIWERSIAGSPVANTISRPTQVLTVLEVRSSEENEPGAGRGSVRSGRN